ncbi:MAG: hypothetical protein IPO06_23540 [Leptospiraceae bacterium]|nr:hypothetical protein [Leptospiraceae bacterium]
MARIDVSYAGMILANFVNKPSWLYWFTSGYSNGSRCKRAGTKERRG